MTIPINDELAKECQKRLFALGDQILSNDIVVLLYLFHDRLIELERKK